MKQLTLSDWANQISPSPTLAVEEKAKELKRKGENVLSFGAGEPDFDTPEFIKEACIKAIKDGKTKYLPAAGLPELREAIAIKHRQDNKIEAVSPEQVVISPGGKFSCYLAILATCGLGDEVLIPSPYWVSYPEMVKLAGATPKILDCPHTQGFKLTVEQLKNALTPKTKLLILNSPSNPTGTMYTQKELEALVNVALSAGIYILSDEIYEYLIYDQNKHYSPASFSSEAAKAVITVSGFSKTFSMTGWRLGTLVADLPIAKAIAKLQSQTTSNATTFAQYGALEATKNQNETNKALKTMLAAFSNRRNLMHQLLTNIKGVQCSKAQGAFYLFPNISAFGLSSNEFAAQLLEKEKIAVVPGVAFGDDGHIRLSYAMSEATISQGLEKLDVFCQSL